MYAERPPTADLAGRLACVWHQVSEADATQLVVPDACVDLIWGPEGLFVAGPDTGPMPTPMTSGDTFVGIRFRPGAVGAFFGVPLQELRDQRVRLSDLPPLSDERLGVFDLPSPRDERVGVADLRALSDERVGVADLRALSDERVGVADLRALSDERLGAPGFPPFHDQPDFSSLHDQRVRGPDLPSLRDAGAGPRTRLDAMLAAVRGRLAHGVPADPAGTAIAGALRTGRTVGEVAWDLGFSERQLHRRTLAAFGYAPKILQRVVRFQRALTLARAGVPLAEVAVTAGYADQAHLSHDVKRLSGVSMRHLVSPTG
ncbi:DUF6597 domain-containing transcriptional factor [Nonomuraea angiospora]|uniref:AraC-like DNA-binding protein n=1 Tax=Nonomuraea angiospora TaxID=46172 RepID=A0ABR9MES6_9ACTN|nr:helix-turn-helix transcriptional regulator [Nonomuraea angiospora]MBE1591070.1 AraC-like DNA-binding protein [Nonomuraea angiospora]